MYKDIFRQDSGMMMGMETFGDELFEGMQYRKLPHRLRMNLPLLTMHVPLEAFPIR